MKLAPPRLKRALFTLFDEYDADGARVMEWCAGLRDDFDDITNLNEVLMLDVLDAYEECAGDAAVFEAKTISVAGLVMVMFYMKKTLAERAP
jgi:hypothetical protein